MSLSVWDLLLYAAALFVLFLTPGPVWLALMARAVSGGFQAAWPLAVGVAVGDLIWPLVAIGGMSWLASSLSEVMLVLRWGACLMFVLMGVRVIRAAGRKIAENRALTRPGAWAGFVAGVAVIMSNPKAILFYMGLLPGFFDLGALGWVDVVVIICLSFTVPLLGNLVMAALVHSLRQVIASPAALRRLNLTSGALLIGVGLLLPFT
ncbi:LysE family translocator [Pseudophaeobacter arcticus]|uniref:LysE family translocator n=1 Tax=Pseudophaeobacter arcticus TaxID=385492 RepID=UPI00041DD049|nr:LysE family translocator [Pseudophaeobacter arcticus]